MKLKRLFSSRNRLGKVKRQLFRGALHVSIYSEQTKLRIRKLRQVLDWSTCVGLSLESVKSPLSRSTRSCTLRKCSFGFRCSRNCRPNLSPYVSPRGLVSRKRREELSQLLSFDKSGARVFSTSREMIVDDYEQPRWKGKSFGLTYFGESPPNILYDVHHACFFPSRMTIFCIFRSLSLSHVFPFPFISSEGSNQESIDNDFTKSCCETHRGKTFTL